MNLTSRIIVSFGFYIIGWVYMGWMGLAIAFVAIHVLKLIVPRKRTSFEKAIGA
jgi:hypothetical protein